MLRLRLPPVHSDIDRDACAQSVLFNVSAVTRRGGITRRTDAHPLMFVKAHVNEEISRRVSIGIQRERSEWPIDNALADPCSDTVYRPFVTLHI
ncbi:hypothetical protein EVAR_52442_1 [Eumeta japonica]|uniref:Uncharacterized protein n=1 Tax=Eumeta variegata TaxID=151549 RepID=A0A4C1YQM7_EUMVA|nr:hypothetical protein EVAR_52442_1 [Eumeta japonica]